MSVYLVIIISTGFYFKRASFSYYVNEDRGSFVFGDLRFRTKTKTGSYVLGLRFRRSSFSSNQRVTVVDFSRTVLEQYTLP